MEKRKMTIKELLSVSVFIGVIGILFVLNLIIPSPEVLVSERRIPARFPDFNTSTVYSGEFMKKFEDWAADHFVFRDKFRAINAFLVFEVYRQNDKSGLYRSSNVGIGEFQRLSESSFRQTSLRILRAAGIFDGLDMNIYYSVIPDKSVFAERYLPGFIMEKAEDILFEMFADFEYIRVIDEMRAECFYRTDLHWDQSMIANTAQKLLSSMGAETKLESHPAVVAGDFKGVYAGQYALPLEPDVMTYIDVPNLKVTYLNERSLEMDEGPVYDLVRFRGVDPYDIFLRGPQPLIVIENENAPQRELYMFRDSFGSSLAPLLTDAYSKIVVIDLRYIHLSLLGNFIDFVPGSDVLFMYGSQIFNNPTILQS
ncbi:MAG: DHHW family protein [Oscillospiraceae bacterium]|nr:DHHW family protein [Oscillospiraceae bacterium]